MGTRLEAVGTVAGGRRGARELADDAIRVCLDAAGVAASDVDLLVNCGIYRDRNLGEPALAALIQEDVGANPGHPPVGGRGTFSFDVANGECGPVTAMQIADGFLRSGVVERGLVVASDADPGRGLAPDFPYEPAGAAALLSWDPSPGGFSHFGAMLFPEHAGLASAEVRWEPRARWMPWRPAGRNLLVVERAEDFSTHAIRCSVTTIRQALESHGLALRDVTALVAPAAGGVGTAVADALGLRAVVAGERVHTAGVLLALARARDEGHLDAGPVLVATASAGIHVSWALHHPSR